MQCGPVSIPGLGVKCGLSLLLVLVLAPWGFLLRMRYSVFPPSPCAYVRYCRPRGWCLSVSLAFSCFTPRKPTFPNSNSIWKQWTKSQSVDVLLKIPFITYRSRISCSPGCFVKRVCRSFVNSITFHPCPLVWKWGGGGGGWYFP